MENIIAQQLIKMQDAIVKLITEKGLTNISAIAEELFEILKAGGCDLLVSMVEEVDRYITDNGRTRKADGLKIKAKNVPRTILTSLGEMTYHRTYYDMEDGQRIYLLDHMIGVEPYERVSREVCAKLVNLAAEMSYEKSAKVGQVDISRQTVCNKVIGLKEVVTEVKRVEKTPKVLHIFTDEDHVHLNGGKSAMVPIATITGGVDTSDPKRHRLIDPLHIAGYGMDVEAFNDQVEACVNARYDINAVEKIYIHGDGAARIASLGEVFPNAYHVLDGFHLEKYLKKLGHYEGASQRIGAVRKALKDGNWDALRKLLDDIIAAQNDKDRVNCKKVTQYLWNNREAAHRRYDETICGSCTEPTVSHVLSERLSRSPFSWSEHGLAKMAMLRVYTRNGGRVVADDIRVSITKEEAKKELKTLRHGWKKYINYMNDQIGSILSADYSDVFEKQYHSFGKVDASFIIRKSFGSFASVV